MVVREVAGETFFLRASEPGVERTPVNIDAVHAGGELEVIDLVDAEFNDFVSYAADVDDGEAATIAAASHQGLPLATDDRGALRLIARYGLDLELHSTASLIRAWAETGMPANETAEAIAAIEQNASFVPGRTDLHYGWGRAASVRGVSHAS